MCDAALFTERGNEIYPGMFRRGALEMFEATVFERAPEIL
jgi:hypothetical protein